MTKRHESKRKSINPHFWVFCEGETEEAYVCWLRSKYRLPIEVVTKVVGNKITGRYIREYKKGKPVHEKDKDFLIYDADVSETLRRLLEIPTAVLIASNPSIELWFLYHYKSQTTEITTENCIGELIRRNRNKYVKGIIDKKLDEKLTESCQKACEHASKSILYKNPSSNMNVFILELKKAKENHNKV